MCISDVEICDVHTETGAIPSKFVRSLSETNLTSPKGKDVFLPLTREVAFAAGKSRRERKGGKENKVMNNVQSAEGRFFR